MLDVSCDLEIDVNSQHIFLLNKKILIMKNCNKTSTTNIKMYLQDFPGGRSGFEYFSRYYYNNDIVDITHSNIIFLNHVSKYMEMDNTMFLRSNFIEKTEKFLDRIDLWTWNELLVALKYGHNMLININNVVSAHKLVDEIVKRLALPSSNCSSFRSSIDSKSTQSSSKSFCFRRFWWFEDLSILDIDLIEMLVKKMVLENFNHGNISRFLFYYQRVKIISVSKDIRGEIIQRLIDLLVILDKRSISIKGLFETLRLVANLKLKRCYRRQLECLIGSQLDQAKLDDLLLISPIGKICTKYNVNIVIRFLKNFLLEGSLIRKLCSYRLKKVARLIDFYACEIAPDGLLKPSKFIALIKLIPDSSRDSYDKLYQAIEIYLEVHARLDEEQKMNLCHVLNYNKLTPQVLNRLSRNPNFPLIAIVKALVHSNPKLTSSIHFFKKSRCNNLHLTMERTHRPRDEEALVKALAKSEKLRAHLQNIGWTLIELEKICSELLYAKKNTNVMAPKECFLQSRIKHLPKLCS